MAGRHKAAFLEMRAMPFDALRGGHCARQSNNACTLPLQLLFMFSNERAPRNASCTRHECGHVVLSQDGTERVAAERRRLTSNGMPHQSLLRGTAVQGADTPYS